MMLPNGWKKVKLGDVIKSLDAGVSVNSVDEPASKNSIGVLKTSCVSSGSFNPKENKAVVSADIDRVSVSVKADRIILSRMNSPSLVGANAYIASDFSNLYLPDRLWQLEPYPNKVNMRWLSYVLGRQETKNRFLNMATGTSNSMKNITKEDVLNLNISLPPIEEQKKIAATLSVWDSAIEKMEKLIEAKENSYDCFLAISIMSDTYAELGTFLTEVSERNKDENIQQVLSVSNSKGFVLPEEQFDRKVASENLSNYKIVRLGQYAYNPSRINVGSIARLNDWKEAVISPMYTVFEIGDQKQLDSDFLLHWLNSSEAKQRIKNSAQGSVRETVGFGDLCKIKIPKFALKKQQKIVSVLNSMNQEITLLMQQLENYKKQKQGLMQKLLTGQWRVK